MADEKKPLLDEREQQKDCMQKIIVSLCLICCCGGFAGAIFAIRKLLDMFNLTSENTSTALLATGIAVPSASVLLCCFLLAVSAIRNNRKDSFFQP